MEFDDIKAFIRYGVDDQQTKDKMLLGALGVVIMAMLCSTFGLFSLRTMWMSVAIYLLSPAFIITLSISSKKLDLKKRIQCSAIIVAFSIMLFTLSSAIFLVIASMPYVFFICLVPIFAACISFLICYIRLKRCRYARKKNSRKYNHMLVFAAVGCAIGYFAIRQMSAWLNSLSVPTEIVIAFILDIVACLFAIMGAPLVLKIYYISKLNSQGLSLED